jgi:hypothetical protein
LFQALREKLGNWVRIVGKIEKKEDYYLYLEK